MNAENVDNGLSPAGLPPAGVCYGDGGFPAVPTLPPGRVLAWEELRTGGETVVPEIYFWESAETCVVVGVSQNAEQETFSVRLAADGVTLLRRASGGGVVLLAPGVLCFAVLAPGCGIISRAAFRESFAALTAPVREAAERLTGRPGGLRGVSDLTLEVAGVARKYGGTAQLCRRKTVLVHGALLASFPPEKMEPYLAYPAESPDYRAGRGHRDFCVSLSQAACGEIPPGRLAGEIARAAAARGWKTGVVPARALASAEVKALYQRKYARPGWNWRRERGNP